MWGGHWQCANMEDDDDDTIMPASIAQSLDHVLNTACPLSYFIKARDEPPS